MSGRFSSSSKPSSPRPNGATRASIGLARTAPVDRARAGRVGTALGLIGTTGVTAHVASATFAGNAPVAQGALTAGTVSITLGGHVDGSQFFDMAVNDMNPGVANARYRLVDVTNAGNLDLKTLNAVIAATAGHSSVLDTDFTNGIQLLIERCSGSGWSAPSGSAPDSTYTCAGTQTTVWSNISGISGVVGTKDLVGAVATGCASPPCSLTAAGTTNHYRFKYWLPSSATNAMQGLTSTLSVQFTGSQRDGINK